MRLPIRIIACTAAAVVAFAANSILCRMALGRGAIDAATFSVIRFVSGAVMLLLISARTGKPFASLQGSWTAAIVLTVYALPFAFAYIWLGAATGALILFGGVQVTMLTVALVSGERPHPVQWGGLAVAIAGLVTLVLPGLTSPSPAGASLMAVASVAWGVYSLRGRASPNPLAETTGNFVRAVPLIAVASLAALRGVHVEARGVLLSTASGALATGLGYVVWYAALRGLTAVRAAVVQLGVPVLTTAGGVLLLGETVTVRLVASTILVLGGIAMAIVGAIRSVRS